MISDFGDEPDAAQQAFDALIAPDVRPTFRIAQTVGNFLERGEAFIVPTA